MTGRRHAYGHGAKQFVAGDPKTTRPKQTGWKKRNKLKARARREEKILAEA